MIAKNMMSIMKENHRNSVWYGDIYLIEKCAIMSGVIKKHTQDTIQCILNALDKSPLFIKGYIVADVSGKKRRYRCFTIRDRK